MSYIIIILYDSVLLIACISKFLVSVRITISTFTIYSATNTRRSEDRPQEQYVGEGSKRTSETPSGEEAILPNVRSSSRRRENIRTDIPQQQMMVGLLQTLFYIESRSGFI